MHTPPSVTVVTDALIAAGFRPFIVGGAVRDHVMGVEPKDFDIEVFGATAAQVTAILDPFGPVSAVGASFGVLKVVLADGSDIDVSLPRRDSKTGSGHRGFLVEIDPSMTTRDAAARRDFTCNALMWDLRDQRMVDHFGGVADIRAGVLRHTSAAFAEDPLRVLRAMQFAARWGWHLHPTTAALCRTLLSAAAELPVERIAGEWHKLTTRSIRPSAGLRVLIDTGWISLWPELHAIVGVPQDVRHHPEGTVEVHTGMVMDAMTAICDRDGITGDRRAILLYAALTHDLGKATHTQVQPDGRITSRGHEAASVPLTDALLTRIGVPASIRTAVAPLVREHMAHASTATPTDTAIRNLTRRLAPASLEDWARLVEADASGRHPVPPAQPAQPWVERGRALGVHATPQPDLVMGRHLIERGIQPSKGGANFRTILGAARAAQEAGTFTSHAEAMDWLDAYLRH